ncbi:lytic transglycosylase domain-containing protein [Limimaricola sp. AA108-03]|uniref:lytic transglycosylase domain-containing protein n=1 Tax=Limimaricola sp. AA108-03 TaxID=3425945 RepID=UPI003D77BEAB
MRIGRRLPGIALAVALGFALADEVAAERIGTDFTFRRIAVPQPGARRITVQISPVAPVAPAAPSAPAAAGSASGAGRKSGDTTAAWFWSAVSPRLADGGPGRLELALAALRDAPPGAAAGPRLQHLQEIAGRYGADIMRATIGTRVSPALVLAVISVESAGRADAVSSAGAQGLMQLMPATAARFGVKDRAIAPENIRGGIAYLDWLMEHFGRDPILALAGYNAGEGSVRDNAGVPPYAETRAYVPKVLAAWTVARGLCLTPPVLMSDGCVFSVNSL